VIAVAALATVAVFAVALWRLGVVNAASGAIAISRDTMGIMRDPHLDERAREQAVQRASLRLIGACGSILLRSALAVLVSLVPVWAFSALGFVTFGQVMEFLSRWDVVVIVTVVMLAGYGMWKRLWA
jgi:hypothetical protein